MRRKRIYVAGKLNDQAVKYIQNMTRMMETANTLKLLGYSVFVPCLDVLMGLKFGTWEYEDYLDNNICWLEVSDAVFLVYGWESSIGTRLEIKRANELGIPVFESFSKLTEWSHIGIKGAARETMPR